MSPGFNNSREMAAASTARRLDALERRAEPPRFDGERDRRIAELLHELSDVRARPSQHSAVYLRDLLTRSREEIVVLVSDLRGWERAAAAGGSLP